MRVQITLILVVVLSTLSGCSKKETDAPIVGTWELVAATTTEKDSTFSTFDPTHKMIKIINPTHFAFLNHAVNTQKVDKLGIDRVIIEKYKRITN